jgi:hypothetical protein
MSTFVPADAPRYVKHCYHYTADGYPEQQDSITAGYFQNYLIPLGKYNKKLFHNLRLQSSRFMYNKKERSVVLLLLLVLLIPLLPQPQLPAIQPPKKGTKQLLLTLLIMLLPL